MYMSLLCSMIKICQLKWQIKVLDKKEEGY